MEEEADRSGSAPMSDALAQSDAEPVAWRWRWRADPPNFTGPPRPNTSAGLIEAAEWLGREAYNEGTTNRAFYYNEAANVLRARAADRSGPDTSAGLNYVPVGGAGNGA